MRNKNYRININPFEQIDFYYLRIFNIVSEFLRNILNVKKKIGLQIY